MRHGKALLGDKVRYTVEMLMSAVPLSRPVGVSSPQGEPLMYRCLL